MFKKIKKNQSIKINDQKIVGHQTISIYFISHLIQKTPKSSKSKSKYKISASNLDPYL